MADTRNDALRQALRKLLIERDICVEALGEDNNREELAGHLEKLARVQIGIDIVRKNLGPSR